MKTFIWESSVFRTRTSQLQSRKPEKSLANHSIRNISTSKSKETRSISHQPGESFLFPRSRLSNFPSRVDTDPVLPEDLKFLQTTEEPSEKPSIERFEEGLKDYKSLFVVHTYARPRRLVSVREKHSNKDISNDSKKQLSSPTIRLGISGWKLSKPRSVTPSNLPFKSKRKNNFLQVISTKLA